jgi:RNA polymerase sigma-70 factor (ECF subfamily)
MPGGRWSVVSDEELAANCVSKLDGAMEELLHRYERRIRACAAQMAADPAEVEDLVQETFLRVIAAVSRFEGHSAFGTWLYRLAHNTCVDSFRREIRQRAHQTGKDDREILEHFLADGQPEEWGDPEAQLEHELASCYAGWLLSTLSPQSRRVVQLRLLDGRSTEEAARMLGTTTDAVKSRLRRARAQLRAAVKDGGSCPFCGYHYEPQEVPVALASAPGTVAAAGPGGFRRRQLRPRRIRSAKQIVTATASSPAQSTSTSGMLSSAIP